MVDWHILPRLYGGWVIQAPGAGHAGESAQTLDEALARARELIGRDGGGQLVVQDEAGEVWEQETVPAADAPGDRQ